MENKLLELIKTRRSCRRYRPVQIEDRELAAVLEAGTFAPTSMGRQDPVDRGRANGPICSTVWRA